MAKTKRPCALTERQGLFLSSLAIQAGMGMDRLSTAVERRRFFRASSGSVAVFSPGCQEALAKPERPD